MRTPLTTALPERPTRRDGAPAAESDLQADLATDLDADHRSVAADSPDTTDDEPGPSSKLFDLSLTQLLGGSMAAATAAALGSRIGVVGTIAGAAVLSVVSAIAGSLYTTSMSRARDVVLQVRSRRDAPAGPAQPVPVRVRRAWSRPDPAARRRALATAGAVFALAAAFLAGLQLATGAPVTGTELGGRSSAGAVVDGSADRANGSSGDGESDEGATPGGDGATTDSPTGTSTSGDDGATGAGSSVTGTPTTVEGGDAPSVPTTATPGEPGAQTPAATSPATPAADPTPGAAGTTGAAGATTPAATPAP